MHNQPLVCLMLLQCSAKYIPTTYAHHSITYLTVSASPTTATLITNCNNRSERCRPDWSDACHHRINSWAVPAYMLCRLLYVLELIYFTFTLLDWCFISIAYHILFCIPRFNLYCIYFKLVLTHTQSTKIETVKEFRVLYGL